MACKDGKTRLDIPAFDGTAHSTEHAYELNTQTTAATEHSGGSTSLHAAIGARALRIRHLERD